MSKEDLLFEKLNEGWTLSDTCNYLEVDFMWAKKLLESYSFPLREVIFYDGTKDIVKDIYKNIGNNFILTKPNDTFTACFLGDLHYTCDQNTNEDYMKYAYDLVCQLGLHHIFNLGDLLDGYLGKNKIKLRPEDQYQYLLQHYPYQEGIYNWYILGNHDVSFIKSFKVFPKPKNMDTNTWLARNNIELCDCNLRGNLAKMTSISVKFNLPYRLNRDRSKDFIYLGEDRADFYLKNDTIALLHETNYMGNSRFAFKGHSHTTGPKTNNCYIYRVPSLSDCQFNGDKIPGLYIVDFNFDNGLIKEIIIHRYIVCGNKLQYYKTYPISLPTCIDTKKTIKFEDKRLVK